MYSYLFLAFFAGGTDTYVLFNRFVHGYKMRDSEHKYTTSRHHSIRFDVKESLLHWALERSGKSPDELSNRQHMRKIDDWLAGTVKPTRPQLEAFAEATYTPFGYLLLSEPPHKQPSTIPHFRTMEDTKSLKRSINLEDAIKITQRRQEWVRDYLLESGASPLEFVGSSKIDDDPIDVANKIRAELGLAQDWTAKYRQWNSAQKYLQEQIEESRIFLSVSNMVQHNPRRLLNSEEFRGFVLVDDYAPFVFVNSNDIGGAQMFTLAHELAHVWLGESASFDLHRLASHPDIQLELTCNRIAAEFLVPSKELLMHWGRFAERPNPYAAISGHFKVSKIVAARRALDTKCILQNEFDTFYDEYMQQVRNKQQELKREQKLKREQGEKNGPSFYVTAPLRISRRFMQTVCTAVGENKLLYREAYSLTGLQSETFDVIKDNVESIRR